MGTLSKLELFLAHNFVLDEQKCEQWGDHVVEGPRLCYDIKPLDEAVRYYRELSVGVAHARVCQGLAKFMIKNTVVDQVFYRRYFVIHWQWHTWRSKDCLEGVCLVDVDKVATRRG